MIPPRTILTPAGLAICIVCMGIVTYALRVFFIALFGKREIPQRLRDVLRFVAPAVLAALVAPALVYNGASMDIAVSNHRLVAGLFAALIAWRTKNVAATILAGMAGLLALDHVW